MTRVEGDLQRSRDAAEHLTGDGLVLVLTDDHRKKPGGRSEQAHGDAEADDEVTRANA